MLYTIGWIGWIGLFALLEGEALVHGTWRDTLSGHVWIWFSMKEQGRAWRLRRTILIGFLAWLCVHFLGGGAIV